MIEGITIKSIYIYSILVLPEDDPNSTDFRGLFPNLLR